MQQYAMGQIWPTSVLEGELAEKAFLEKRWQYLEKRR